LWITASTETPAGKGVEMADGTELLVEMMRTMQQFHAETMALIKTDVAEFKSLAKDVSDIKEAIQELKTERDANLAVDANNRRWFRNIWLSVTATGSFLWWLTTKEGIEWINNHLK
jgi:di/tripeptidase